MFDLIGLLGWITDMVHGRSETQHRAEPNRGSWKAVVVIVLLIGAVALTWWLTDK